MNKSKAISYRSNLAIYGLMLLIMVYIGKIQELIPGLEKLYLGKIAMLLSFVLAFAAPGLGKNQIFSHVQTKYITWIGIISIISCPFGVWPGGSFTFINQSYLKVFILFYFMIIVIDSVQAIEKAVWAISISVFCLGLATLLSDATGRISSTITYDPNDLAFVMVSLLPIVYFFATDKKGLIKIFLYLVICLMLVTCLKTASRGGLIGLLVVAIAILYKQRSNLGQLILPFLLGVVVFSTFASPEYWERMSTLLSPTQDYNVTESGGRIEIWKHGVQIMLDNPLLGVGINNFEVSEGQLHGGAGKWSSPHNTFIQIGAELGIVALILFLKTILSTLKALKACRPGSGISMWILDGTEVAMYGYIASGFFLTQAYSPIFMFIVALSICARQLAQQPETTQINSNGQGLADKTVSALYLPAKGKWAR